MHLQSQLQSVQAEQRTSEQYASDRMGLRRADFYHRRACCLPGRKSPNRLYGKNRQELLYAESSPGPLFPGRGF